MPSFLEKLLSGRYPAAAEMWRNDFSKMVDEVFATPSPADGIDETDPIPTREELELHLEEANDTIEHQSSTITALRGTVSRLESMLAEYQSRLDALNRQYEVVRRERGDLQLKVDAVQHALKTSMRGEQVG